MFLSIATSAIGTNFCVITAGIQKHKSVIKKKTKKHNKILLLGKAKLDNIKVLISKTSIDSHISHHRFSK